MIFDYIFVTVGTTEFDDLIKEIDSKRFLDFLLLQKCVQLTLQVGRGTHDPSFLRDACVNAGIIFECYRFKTSLEEDMRSASFIVSHAGIIGLIISNSEMYVMSYFSHIFVYIVSLCYREPGAGSISESLSLKKQLLVLKDTNNNHVLPY